jgi:hypothetical protein
MRKLRSRRLPAGNLHYTVPDLSPADSLWEDCPILALLCDPTIGHMDWEQFRTYDPEATVGDWVLTQATAGSAALAADGVLNVDAGSTTANQGANIQKVKSIVAATADSTIWAEFQVALTNITAANVFVGLAAVDTTIFSAGALNVDDLLGFYKVTADAALLGNAEKATVLGTAVAAHTLVASTYVRLGIKVVGLTSAQLYVNGLPVGTPFGATHIPTVNLVPTFVCQTRGTSQPVLSVRPFRVVRLRGV